MIDILCCPKHKNIFCVCHIHLRTKFHKECNHSGSVVLGKRNIREIKLYLSFMLIRKNITRLKILCYKNPTALYTTSLTTEFSENFFTSLVDWLPYRKYLLLRTKYFILLLISSSINRVLPWLGIWNWFESAVFGTNFTKWWSSFLKRYPTQCRTPYYLEFVSASEYISTKVSFQNEVQPLPSGSYVWKTLLACSEGASGATRAISLGKNKKEKKT